MARATSDRLDGDPASMLWTTLSPTAWIRSAGARYRSVITLVRETTTVRTAATEPV